MVTEHRELVQDSNLFQKLIFKQFHSFPCNHGAPAEDCLVRTAELLSISGVWQASSAGEGLKLIHRAANQPLRNQKLK